MTQWSIVKHVVLLDHISPTEARATDHTTLEANTIISTPTKFTYMYVLLHTHYILIPFDVRSHGYINRTRENPHGNSLVSLISDPDNS